MTKPFSITKRLRGIHLRAQIRWILSEEARLTRKTEKYNMTIYRYKAATKTALQEGDKEAAAALLQEACELETEHALLQEELSSLQQQIRAIGEQIRSHNSNNQNNEAH